MNLLLVSVGGEALGVYTGTEEDLKNAKKVFLQYRDPDDMDFALKAGWDQMVEEYSLTKVETDTIDLDFDEPEEDRS